MKLMKTLALCVIGLALPAAAATPERFDLICHSQTTTSAPDIKPIEKTSDQRMSVDLGRRLWCWHKGAACSQVLPVGAASGGVLKLGRDIGAQGESRIEVDLSSGAFSSLIRVRSGIIPEITSTAKGRCMMAPFTPGLL